MSTLDGFVAGDVVTLRLAVTPVDDRPTDHSTTARIALTAPDGSPVALVAHPSADRSEWTATLGDAQAGEYVGRWTVTGTGEGSEAVRILVAPEPGNHGRTYATSGDLAHWTQDAPPRGSRLLLARATARVDELLVAAVYDVDARGMPRHGDGCDPPRCVVGCPAGALRDATCAQAAWFDEQGDESGSGAADRWSLVRIGNVQLGSAGAGGGAGDAGSGSSRYAPDMVRALRSAGLLSPGSTAPGIPGNGWGAAR